VCHHKGLVADVDCRERGMICQGYRGGRLACREDGSVGEIEETGIEKIGRRVQD